MMMRKVLLLVGCFAVSVYGAVSCADNNVALQDFIVENNLTSLIPPGATCVDLENYCADKYKYGPTALAQYCNCTCAGVYWNPDQLPPPDPNDPVQIVLLSGQSECKGNAKPDDLLIDSSYTELQADIPNAWLAELNETGDMVIGPMNAQNGLNRFLFGPEVSFAQRFQIATGKRILVIKYCEGGTGIHDNWDPDNSGNRWDYANDDGSAEWLFQNGVNLNSNQSLFVNAIYTVRLTLETLQDAGIDYEWSAILWLQGEGDKVQGIGTANEAGWRLFGQNTARVFDMFREYAAETWDLPIIDEGANGALTLRTGKAIAHQTTKGCNVGYVPSLHLTFKAGSVCECEDCPCHQVNAILRNESYEFYGYQPDDPDRPHGNLKNFSWYVDWGDRHSGYEGMILKGRTMANVYLKEFYKKKNPGFPGLTDEMKADDASELFPVPRCMPGDNPSVTNFCWSDLRNEDEAAKECIPQPPDSDSFSGAPAVFQTSVTFIIIFSFLMQ